MAYRYFTDLAEWVRKGLLQVTPGARLWLLRGASPTNSALSVMRRRATADPAANPRRLRLRLREVASSVPAESGAASE